MLSLKTGTLEFCGRTLVVKPWDLSPAAICIKRPLSVCMCIKHHRSHILISRTGPVYPRYRQLPLVMITEVALCPCICSACILMWDATSYWTPPQARPEIGSLPVLWLPVLGQIEQRAPLRLRGMGGQIRLHVVFGEGERRPGDPIGAGAAEARQRRRTGRVFVIVVRTEQFDSVLVMKTFRAEVDAGSSRAATHHTGHGELGMVR
ncbi:hypothetical protein EYF80_029635 [Liparis tanakae]|uniref:Uncharacterized protein n=1 Tax=Liparis tanakae TaxID=230148 RepID=A0A4Z2H5I0_9TELE|nr:hypothetical protein EYF80_029635 [Liparis tanakae]